MSEGDSVGDSVHGKPSVVYRFFTRLGQIYQSWLDKSTPYTAVRWVVTLGLSFVYMIRVYLLQGWYIVTYALGIYHLNLFIAFLSPKVDPSLMEDSETGFFCVALTVLELALALNSEIYLPLPPEYWN